MPISENEGHQLFQTQVMRQLDRLQQAFNDINDTLPVMAQKSNSHLVGLDALVEALKKVGESMMCNATAIIASNNIVQEIAASVERLAADVAQGYRAVRHTRGEQHGRASRSALLDEYAVEDTRSPGEIDRDTHLSNLEEATSWNDADVRLRAHGQAKDEEVNERAEKRSHH